MEHVRTIDRRLESYTGIYDHALVREIKKVTNGTWVQAPFFDLCMHWKAASNALRLPYLTIQCLETTFGEATIRRLPGGVYLDALSRQLLSEVPNLPSATKFLISSKIAELISRVDRQNSTKPSIAQVETERIALWNKLIDAEAGNEFPLSIMGSQQIAFNAIFGAFENFMREILALLEKDSDFRVSYSKKDHVKKYLSGHLPASQVDAFFCSGGNFDIARVIRNSLAHHGGRRTDEIDGIIKEPRFRYEFDDGKWVRIWPENNRHLMNLLLSEIASWSSHLVKLVP